MIYFGHFGHFQSHWWASYNGTFYLYAMWSIKITPLLSL